MGRLSNPPDSLEILTDKGSETLENDAAYLGAEPTTTKEKKQ